MASISLPPQSRSGFSQHFHSATPSSINPRNRLSMPAPLPNPPFVFPARDPDAPDPHLATTEGRTPAALPAFSFNPGAGQSLQPPTATNPRAGGHRRRHSEFVGNDQLVTPDFGEKREDSSSLSQPSAPSGPPPGRGPGRRHHAHRRSTAVSGVDLNAISKALGTTPSALSAPNTPGDKKFDHGPEDTSRPLSFSATSLGRPTPPASPLFPPESPMPPVPPIPTAIQLQLTPKDDEAEIGRPVSAISQETQANAPAVRFEPPPEDPPPVRPRPAHDRKSKPRPKTADPSFAFDLCQSKSVPDIPAIKRSKSTGHSRSRKSRSTGHLDATLANNVNDDVLSSDASRPSYSDDGSDASSDTDNEEDGSLPAKKSRSKSKKKKRVRSWAGAILTRGKGKRHAKAATKQRPPALTPPALTRTNSDVGSMEVDFDNDDVVVLRTPNKPEDTFAAAESAKKEPPIPVPTLETAWKPRSFYEQTAQGDTLSSPIIDLDAALGPFNTPDMGPARGTPSKFSLVTQRMYSGGRRGEFVGPEMRYHRRTESAPALQPFDRSALGLIRLGGNTLETPDVFYEEEEDAFLAANPSPKNETVPADALADATADATADTPAECVVTTSSDSEKESVEPVKSVESVEHAKSLKSNDTTDDTLTRAPGSTASQSTAPQHQGLGIQAANDNATKQADPAAPVDPHAVNPMHTTVNPFNRPPRSPVEILKSEERVPKAQIPPSPDVSPGFLAVDKRPATSPHDLPSSILPFSLSAGVSPSDSPFPSPDAPRSSNGRNFSSHSYHHLPSDYPYTSVEDVPSLTSSASTMTFTMNRFSASFFPRPRLSTDRAASFSTAVHGRTNQANSSKRSSLASLSKLVSGHQSERSKLYQEEKPPSDVSDKSKKRGRRLSRLMHFWKLRDTEKADTEAAAPPERRARG